MHKKVVRNINGSQYNSHTEPIMKKLDLLTLRDLHCLNLATFVFKYKINSQPDCIMDMFNKIKYNNRSHIFTIEKQRYAYFKQQSPYLFLSNWNSTNIAHKNLLNIKEKQLSTNKARLNAFKAVLKTHMSMKYQVSVKCSNEYCSDCTARPSPHLSQLEL